MTLDRDWALEEVLPLPKKPQKLPIILSPDEVRFLGCVLFVKHHAILMTCYAAGLRISEAVQLKPSTSTARCWSFVSSRAKGQKDRYVMLSPKLLEILHDYCRAIGVALPRRSYRPADHQGCGGTRMRESARPLRLVQTGHPLAMSV
ncbi:hypothetical protein X727_33130 [Mesorhizobium sp. L103C119B0]|nr:hypothetical protein X727_33130 [Mesorhizobium sp. L103C119B0]